MKATHITSLFAMLFITGILMQSCQDTCTVVDKYMAYEPVYLSFEDLRNSVSSESPRELVNPGKIYKYNSFILINERDEGLHVIDNSSPSAPNPVAFIRIPGNTDMAVRNGYLYANNFIDLVVIDLANPLAPVEVGRVEGIFPQRTYANGIEFENPEGVITSFELVPKEEVRNVDCGQGKQWSNGWEVFQFSNTNLAQPDVLATTDLSGNGTGRNDDVSGGTGGSMARFTIVGNYLYVVDDAQMQLFDLSSPSRPVKWSDVELGLGIETIFPYQNHLFIGSQTGMHIYNNDDPSNPTYVSTYEHVTSCDPVVVEGNYAYVTLRSGNPCQTWINQLDVVDITDLNTPTLKASYPMNNPHGLGIDNSILFLCDADAGLKVFNAADPFRIDQNQLSHIGNVHAYDVIPQNRLLLLIGDDGFYQYDYTNPANLQYLSKIAVN